MRSKLLTTLLMLLAFVTGAWADEVNANQALQIATRFFAHLPSSAEDSPSSAARRAAGTDMMRVAYTSQRDNGEVENIYANDGQVIFSPTLIYR